MIMRTARIISVQKSGSFVTSTLFTNNPYPDQQKQRAGSTESVLPVFYSQNVNLKEEGADRMEWCDILSVHRERQITSSTVPHDFYDFTPDDVTVSDYVTGPQISHIPVAV